MTDIVLINPGASSAIYQNLSEDLSAIEPPTWLRMNAGWLRDRGYRVEIIDQDALRWTPKQVAQQVKALAPKLVAIIVSGQQPSASTQQMAGASEVCRAVQGAKKILVGNHPSALPQRTFREEDVNYVCDGEGPITLSMLLDEFKLKDVLGLVWDGGSNPRAPLIPMDELHGDVWDLLPMEKYRAHTWQCLDGSPRSPYASVYTTLGCPFKCHFCMINVFQHSNQYRRRSPERVVDQIRRLYLYQGVRTLKIADEMFVLDKTHYLPICEGLSQLPFAEDLNIWAYARIDTVRPDTLKLLRKAGIRWLALGIESGSSMVRDGAEKSLSDQDIRDVVKAIQNAGINVIGNFIFGLPDDTRDSLQATLSLSKSLDLEFVNYYSAMAYPGSKLFDMANPEDLPGSWSGYSQHSLDAKPLPTATLSSAEILAFRDQAFIDFFSDPRYLERIDKKFGNISAIQSMMNQKLTRAVA